MSHHSATPRGSVETIEAGRLAMLWTVSPHPMGRRVRLSDVPSGRMARTGLHPTMMTDDLGARCTEPIMSIGV